MDNKFIKILGFKVHRITYDELLDYIEESIQSKKFFRFAMVNPFYLLEAIKYNELKNYINSCDVVTPDGFGIILAGLLLGNPFPERVTGTDLLPKLAKKGSEKGWRFYFLGAKPGVAETTYKNLKKMFPEFNVVGIQHGYFSETEEEKVVKDIKEKKPDILVVCLGVYKQDMFIQKYQKKIGIPVAYGTGASFDFHANKVKRAPKWMQKIGLEWFWRLIQEPKRLWKRYLIGNTIFIFLVFKELVKKLFQKKG